MAEYLKRSGRPSEQAFELVLERLFKLLLRRLSWLLLCFAVAPAFAVRGCGGWCRPKRMADYAAQVSAQFILQFVGHLVLELLRGLFPDQIGQVNTRLRVVKIAGHFDWNGQAL